MNEIIRIGFSGTRNGMTRVQLLAVYSYMCTVATIHDTAEPAIVEAHHGDCTGADAQFHVIATVLGCRTVAHPPTNATKRAWCKADEIREPKDYLARDWDIAQETSELIAAPDGPPRRNSGTWATVSYAVQLGRKAWVYLPDGNAGSGRDWCPSLLVAKEADR